MFLTLLIFSLLLSVCAKKAQPLNPDKPITINLWHYYGSIKEKFDTLVSEFNETVGTEQGIIVETESYGEIKQLETALFDAAKQSVGSSPMPDIFASYADHAYRMANLVDLIPLEDYFSTDELMHYRKELLQERQFLNDQKSYILPIAKSTENLFVNKTDWERFATKQ